VASLLSRLHQFAPSIAAYERALRVDPENSDNWNRLGYTNAYLGRLPAARQAIERYRQLEPAEPNPLDSLGEVHYMGGQFKLAGDYFQAAFAKSPQFEGGRALLKSAYARLLDGQFDEADRAFTQYAKATEGSPATELARAHWLYTSGKPEAALAGLTEVAGKATGPLAALYQAHRCGLLLRTDRAAAQAAARVAIASAPAPVALLCGFLSQPSATPAEWSARVDRAFNSAQAAGFRRQALAYALFFDGHYADAFPLIETLALESNPDGDSELRALLAECQWRTGRWAAARETLARWPLPAADSIFGGQHVPAYVAAILKTGEHFDDNAVAKRWPPIASRIARSLK
jgi:Flp pilus assembly protein TadD